MIPPNLTYDEVGAFLMAVGEHMRDYDVCAGAVLDAFVMDNEAYLTEFCESIKENLMFKALGQFRSEELARLTLEEAINFNEADHATHT
jgi:hypothetical protein